MMNVTQVAKTLRHLGFNAKRYKAAGQALAEYGLIFGLVTLVAIVGLTQMRDMFIEMFTYLSTFLSNIV
jgi:Flp pilus assembly pilin Flp